MRPVWARRQPEIDLNAGREGAGPCGRNSVCGQPAALGAHEADGCGGRRNGRRRGGRGDALGGRWPEVGPAPKRRPIWGRRRRSRSTCPRRPAANSRQTADRDPQPVEQPTTIIEIIKEGCPSRRATCWCAQFRGDRNAVRDESSGLRRPRGCDRVREQLRHPGERQQVGDAQALLD